jgi:malate permease and related proteins
MEQIFLQSFLTMLYAVAKIMMIAIIAGVLVRKNVIEQQHIKGLSEITVMVLLPALMFTNTINTFKPGETVGWWILPLLGMAMPLLGLSFSYLVFWKRPSSGKNILAVASFPNAAYLVLPIGQLVFPEQFDEFALFCFLFVMGYNPVLWSVGKFFSTQTGENYTYHWKEFITPPLIANLSAVIIVLLDIHIYIPEIILEPVEMISMATVPMATFILGATLGGLSFKIWPRLTDLIKVILVKFILIPGTVLTIVYFLNINQYSALFATFLIIEASAAPATNLIVMIRKYGGDIQQVGSLLLVSYFVAIIAMPLWMAVWELIKLPG